MPPVTAPPLAALAAAALLIFAAPAGADLPVHCLRHQIVGDWTFVLGKPSATRTSCGHKRPDIEAKQPARNVVDRLPTQERAVSLLEPNSAVLEGKRGTWTMVYDEGFEVRVGDWVYFAFSNFTFDQKAPKHNVSHCGETMVGWYSNAARTQFGCYYGAKRERSGNSTANASAVVAAAASRPASKKTSSTRDRPLNHATQAKKVAKINEKLAMLQLGWKARPMMKWNGRTMREINSFAGLRRTKHVAHGMHQAAHAAAAVPTEGRSFLQRKDALAVAPALPATWDWSSSAGGVNFLEPVMDQGDCGSCYDASTMRMLTARHKIKTNNTEAIPWSINFPLFCSEYNQGCKGGYGFLTTKWSQEVGLIPATCMRYDTLGSCQVECDPDKELKGKKRYRAANHRYINAWYGNFNSPVEAIQLEIYKNGPVVLSFEPSEDFMFYSEGIYSTPVKAKKKSKLKKHVDFDQEWEQVDHAVVAVGYGEEKGKQYWTMQNSWGQDWGEDGFFRIARGVDESGIESIPEAADVVEDEQNGRQVDAILAEHQRMRAPPAL